MPFTESVTVRLSDESIWRQFNNETTEMVITQSGRRMFPSLQCMIEGLDENQVYAIFLHMERVDENRYKFVDGNWEPTGETVEIKEGKMVPHHAGAMKGSAWMSTPVSFHRVKLTENGSGNIPLIPMCKYRPVITIMKCHFSDPFYSDDMLQRFTLPFTEFIAVHSYLNNAITQLKIDYNPFAKGFRQECDTNSGAKAVKVLLANETLWQQFNNCPTEMVITQSGRKMFPTLDFVIEGLDENEDYSLFLHMERVDGIRYKYVGKQWVPAGEVKERNEARSVAHHDGVMKGSEWMTSPVRFNKVKLVDNESGWSSDICLVPMCKYRPVLTIVKSFFSEGSSPSSSSLRFTLPYTEFYAVRAYKNSAVTQLKIEHSTFALGFGRRVESARSNTAVHFKLEFNGRKHRFAHIDRDEQIFNEVKASVAKIIQKDSFKLYWNVDDFTVLVETSHDIFQAIDQAKRSSSQPPCVHLTVTLATESHTEELQQGEPAATESTTHSEGAMIDALMVSAIDELKNFQKQEKANDFRRMQAILKRIAPYQRIQVSSFRVETLPLSNDDRMTFYFASQVDHFHWLEYLRASFSVLNLSVDKLTTHDRCISFDVDSDKRATFLDWLKPLAIRTDFDYVKVEEGLLSISYFLECATVKQLTISQKPEYSADQFAHWLEFVRIARPSKVGVERLEPTKDLISFLVQLANLTDSIWIGGPLSKGSLYLSDIREILSRKCRYLHIRDKETKISLGQMEDMAKYFINWGLKVSLIMPTNVNAVEAQVGNYRVKKIDAVEKYAYENDLVQIEHEKMESDGEYNM